MRMDHFCLRLHVNKLFGLENISIATCQLTGPFASSLCGNNLVTIGHSLRRNFVAIIEILEDCDP